MLRLSKKAAVNKGSSKSLVDKTFTPQKMKFSLKDFFSKCETFFWPKVFTQGKC